MQTNNREKRIPNSKHFSNEMISILTTQTTAKDLREFVTKANVMVFKNQDDKERGEKVMLFLEGVSWWLLPKWEKMKSKKNEIKILSEFLIEAIDNSKPDDFLKCMTDLAKAFFSECEEGIIDVEGLKRDIAIISAFNQIAYYYELYYNAEIVEQRKEEKTIVNKSTGIDFQDHNIRERRPSHEERVSILSHFLDRHRN